MEYLKLEKKDRIAWVTIDRQKKLNALNTGVLKELESTFLSLKDDPEVAVIVLTGAGEKSFVAGADISQFPAMTAEEAYAFSRIGQEVFNLIESSTRPVIAAVNGFALGGGCELALACHLRIASENATFGQPEVKLGVIAGYGGTQRLPRLIGTGRALDMLLTARMVKSGEALEMGLVNAVYPLDELLDRATILAQRIMENGPQAQAQTIQAVYAGIGQSLTEGLELEATAFREVFQTEDRVEGAQAFLERRTPEFKNK